MKRYCVHIIILYAGIARAGTRVYNTQSVCVLTHAHAHTYIMKYYAESVAVAAVRAKGLAYRLTW